jgi:integrase
MIGALAGLRTGEVFALKWAHVDLARIIRPGTYLL